MRSPAVVGILAALVLLPAAAGAQESPPEADPAEPRLRGVHGVAALRLERPLGVRVPRRATDHLRSEREHAFGIRLRVNTTFGFYDLKTTDVEAIDIPDQLGTFAFVPGVEFPIVMGESWTLVPFLDAGFATDTEIHQTTGIVGVGLRSRAALHDSRHAYLLWNELVRARNSSTDVSSSDDYALFRTDFEMRGLVVTWATCVQTSLLSWRLLGCRPLPSLKRGPFSPASVCHRTSLLSSPQHPDFAEVRAATVRECAQASSAARCVPVSGVDCTG